MISHPRRVALRALVAIVAAALVLVLAPFDLAAIRIGPLSLMWWYTVVVAPLAAAVIAAVALTATPS